MKVISCKRNTDVKLHLNLQVNLNLVTNVTYAHTHVRTYGRNIKAKHYMPHSCLRQAGAKLAGKLEPGYERDIRTYACTDVTSRQNAICPTPAFGRWGHKKIQIFSEVNWVIYLSPISTFSFNTIAQIVF